jgi:hypothetical protein
MTPAPKRRLSFTLRTLFVVVTVAAMIAALANGNRTVVIAALCWFGLFSLMGGWMRRTPPDAETQDSVSTPLS